MGNLFAKAGCLLEDGLPANEGEGDAERRPADRISPSGADGSPTTSMTHTPLRPAEAVVLSGIEGIAGAILPAMHKKPDPEASAESIAQTLSPESPVTLAAGQQMEQRVLFITHQIPDGETYEDHEVDWKFLPMQIVKVTDAEGGMVSLTANHLGSTPVGEQVMTSLKQNKYEPCSSVERALQNAPYGSSMQGDVKIIVYELPPAFYLNT